MKTTPQRNHSQWDSGRDRFAVTPGRKLLPVLGYVSQNTDKTWRVERAGQFLPDIFPTAAAAAQALIDLSPSRI